MENTKNLSIWLEVKNYTSIYIGMTIAFINFAKMFASAQKPTVLNFIYFCSITFEISDFLRTFYVHGLLYSIYSTISVLFLYQHFA